jgi:hypothetical protein
VIDREGLTALMQSFGLLLRKCEEAARQRAHEPVVVVVSDDDDDDTTPRLPGFGHLRRVLNYSSSSSSEKSEDDDDEGIFTSQGDPGSENSIPYEEENAQDTLVMESDFFQNGALPANMAEHEIIEISDIDWGSDFPE